MEEEHPKPPIAGVIYGRICYWIVIIGIIVSVVGMIMYFASDGYVNEEKLLDSLWAGDEVEDVWKNAAGVEETPHGHWYFSYLEHGDVIAMLGIAICCVAAVIGMWGALIGAIRSGERVYTVFAAIVAAILTLSAIGVLRLEH